MRVQCERGYRTAPISWQGRCRPPATPEPAHRAALGVEHDKVQPAQLQMLATLGHPAHFVRDEPADGVKVLARRTALDGYPECFGDPIDGRVAAHGRSCRPDQNVARVFGNVEFVFDFAHDLSRARPRW